MLKITDYKLRESLEGRTFFALTLQGGIEIVKSSNGGNYVTVRKCSLPTTFNEATCVSLLGHELPGRVEKVECEPYEYAIPQTGKSLYLLTGTSMYRKSNLFSKTSSRCTTHLLMRLTLKGLNASSLFKKMQNLPSCL